MKLLLDTHALLWWLADDAHLGRHARRLIEDPVHDILMSVASLWEIVVKVRAGKLQADVDEVAEAAARGGFELLGIKTAHLRTLAALPIHHRDPFDHLLIAQAVCEDAVFVSDDRPAGDYPVRIITCSGA